MIAAKRLAVASLITLLLPSNSASEVNAQGPSSEQVVEHLQYVLDAWQEALQALDHEAYRQYLHSAVLAVPEYSSPVAMEFWREELNELTEQGFDGRFCFEIGRRSCFAGFSNDLSGRGRIPGGAVGAYPVVGDRPLQEAVVLIEDEAGAWKILRLFE